MISFLSVSKLFGEIHAINNMTFKTKEGEVIGFLGPNGAGKTTTMRLILGYLQPTSGKIFVFGKSPIDDKIDVLTKIGYLPENNPLYGEMIVREYLSFIAKIKKESSYEKAVTEVGITEVLDKKIESLSRGYKQRVGLAAALLGNPSILILDEPTSGLDPIEQDKIKSLIKSLAKQKTIIFSTHILSEVEAVANRLIILNKGVIVYDGDRPRGKGEVEKLFKRLVKS